MSILTQKGNPDSLLTSFTIMTLPYMCMESIEDLFSKKNALYKDKLLDAFIISKCSYLLRCSASNIFMVMVGPHCHRNAHILKSNNSKQVKTIFHWENYLYLINNFLKV